MRIDKFLKVSRLIKRRTVAAEACSSDRVTVNGRPAKPSTLVKEGDEVTVRFGNRTVGFRVLSVKETVRKEEADHMYEILSQTE